MMSFEEILQTRSIEELRTLVGELEVEGKSKQSELQQMVGSTYHDFIQSADAIANMRVKSDNVFNRLQTFVVSSRDIIEKSSHLLSYDQDGSKNLESGGQGWNFDDISSSKVWEYLEVCDIFHAAKVIVQAALILRQCRMCQDTHDSKLLPPPVGQHEGLLKSILQHMGETKREELEQRCRIVYNLRETVLEDCHMLFLHCGYPCEASSYSSSTLSSKSTITISGDFTLSERAHSLAAFTALHCPLLTASTTGRESGSESVLTPSQIDQLVVATGLSGYSHRVKASVGGGDEAKGGSNQPDDHEDEKLQHDFSVGVQSLQLAAIDMFALFLLPPSESRVVKPPAPIKGAQGIAAPSQGQSLTDGTGTAGCLVLEHLKQFLTDIFIGVVESYSVIVLDQQQAASKTNGQDAVSVLIGGLTLKEELMQQAFIDIFSICNHHLHSNGILHSWYDWIHSQVKMVSNHCVISLFNMKNASRVGLLQQAVMRACSTYPQVAGDYRDNKGGGGASVESLPLKSFLLMKEVDVVVLTHQLRVSSQQDRSLTSGSHQYQHQHQHQHGLNSPLDPGDILWNRIFKSAFTSQMHQILTTSFRDIFHKTSHTLVKSIQVMGIDMDHKTLQVSVPDTAQSSYSSKHLSKSPLGDENKHLLGNINSVLSVGDSKSKGWLHQEFSVASSNKALAFQMSVSSLCDGIAEGVRKNLEEQLTSLTADVMRQKDQRRISSTHSRDMDHIVRSINTQCCVLVGQFLVLLRTVVDTLVKLFTSQKFAFTDEYTARLHHAVVMLGRLAWKLQTYQGDFMRTAIASSSSAASRRTEGSGNVSSADSENTSTAAGGVYMTSLEQLVAAFDIADTDGDGYITYDEAVEAAKALWIRDSSTGAVEQDTEFDFLWWLEKSSAKTLNYSIEEFRLVCSNMIPPFSPQSSLPSSLQLWDSASCLSKGLALLVDHAHDSWLNHICTMLYPVCLEETRVQYSTQPTLQSGVGGSASDVVYPKISSDCRHLWQTVSLSLGEGEGGGGEESPTALIPSGLSIVAHQLMGVVTGLWQSCIVSVQTIFPLHNPLARSETDCRSLADKLRERITICCMRVLIKCLCEVFDDFSHSCHSASLPPSSFTPTAAVKSKTVHPLLRGSSASWLQWSADITTSIADPYFEEKISYAQMESQQCLEDVCLQITFDLNVFHNVLLADITTDGRRDIPGDTHGQMMRVLLSDFNVVKRSWEDTLDPINAQLILPLVHDASREYCTKRVSFLLPFGSISSATSDGDAISSSLMPSASAAVSSVSGDDKVSPKSPSKPASAASIHQEKKRNKIRFTLYPLPVVLSTTVNPYKVHASAVSSSSHRKSSSGTLKGSSYHIPPNTPSTSTSASGSTTKWTPGLASATTPSTSAKSGASSSTSAGISQVLNNFSNLLGK